MEKYEFSEIPVKNLLLDVNNPRHDILEDQNDAIREMIVDQHEKLVNLARDIIQEGINPSELTIVTPDENDLQKYVVLEGNRRLAAIKLLSDPSLAKLGEKPSVVKFFEESAGKVSGKLVTKLSCVVFDSRDDATHWIQLKHTGENKGIGVVSWDSEAVARFKQRLGKSSPALQVVEFVKKNAKLREDEKEGLDNIRLTNSTTRLHSTTRFRLVLRDFAFAAVRAWPVRSRTGSFAVRTIGGMITALAIVQDGWEIGPGLGLVFEGSRHQLTGLCSRERRAFF